MSRKPLLSEIWVPGEGTEYGVVVADIREDQEVTVPEKGEDVMVPGRGGILRKRKAVRGELVKVIEGRGDKRIALVRFKGFKKDVSVLVLGDWQLAGEKAPPAEAAGA